MHEVPCAFQKSSINGFFCFSCKYLPGHTVLFTCWQRLNRKGTVNLEVRGDVRGINFLDSGTYQSNAVESLSPTISSVYYTMCPPQPHSPAGSAMNTQEGHLWFQIFSYFFA
jgi:hypothetical protein